MDSARLKTLRSVSEPQYSLDCPILLSACALYLDTATNNCIAQMKWRNLDRRLINAVMVEITTYDIFQNKLETNLYQYTRLSVTMGCYFGEQTAILLQGSEVGRYTINVKAVSFDDDSLWKNDKNAVLEALPSPCELNFSSKIFEQYKRDLNRLGFSSSSQYAVQKAMNLWQCGCGCWQSDNSPCLNCGITSERLKEAQNLQALQVHLAAYDAEQEQLHIESARKAEEERKRQEAIQQLREKEKEKEKGAQKRQKAEYEQNALRNAYIRKRRKRRFISCLFILLLIVFTLWIIFWANPTKRYDLAIALMKHGNYTDAQMCFSSLENYADAAKYARQCQYYAEKTSQIHVNSITYGYDSYEHVLSLSFLNKEKKAVKAPAKVTLHIANEYNEKVYETPTYYIVSDDFITRSDGNGEEIKIPIDISHILPGNDTYGRIYCDIILGDVQVKEMSLVISGLPLKETQQYKNFSYIPNSNGVASICGYDGMAERILIPQRINEYVITYISSDAFRGNEKLRAVTIPEGIQRMGDFTFYECKNIETICLPNSLTAIGVGAFAINGQNDGSALTLIVNKGSYAEEYAIANNLTYKFKP